METWLHWSFTIEFVSVKDWILLIGSTTHLDVIYELFHLGGILSCFGQFYRDVSLSILKLRDHGCQVLKMLSFACFPIEIWEKSPNFKELDLKLSELWSKS